MKALSQSEIKSLINTLKSKNYVVYEEPQKLNIVGVRKDTNVPNKFDDWIYVFFKNLKNNWEGYQYEATTDAGTYYLKNPYNQVATAILKDGQYVNAYQQGLHKSQYKALVQRGKVSIWRDYNRDAILDFNNGREETGSGFGINIHRASSVGTTPNVNEYSAGCQVFANIDDFNHFMRLTDIQASKYGNNFTYTLIDERAYNRKKKRYGVYLILGTILLASGWTLLRSLKDKPLLPKFRKG
jgi:hypothetical protein